MSHFRNVCLATLVVLLSAVCLADFCSAQVTKSAGTPDIDESYFLVRTLEALYERWPQDVSNPDLFSDVASDLRREAIRLRVRAEKESLEQEIIDGYNEYVSLLDSYTRFLTNIGAIRQAARDEASKDSFESGHKAGFAGGSTFGALSRNDDATTTEAVVASLLVAGVTYAVDSWGKSAQRDLAEEAAVATAAQKITDETTETLERTKQRFESLAKKRKWSPAEVGWTLSQDQANAILSALKNDDTDLILRECDRQRRERPNDPFIQLAHNYARGTLLDLDVDAVMAIADESYNVTKLIPDGDVYFDYRFECISQAASFASRARNIERRNTTILRKSPVSEKALNLWREVLELQPSDPTGVYRFNFAIASFENADIGPAIERMTELFTLLKENPDYLYWYACMLSREGDYDTAIKNLIAAISLGHYDIAGVREDPDLVPLRGHWKDEFEKLVTPQWSWRVTDDLLWDDVVLKNESLYPLTNIEFTVTLKKGASTTPVTLRCDAILPGVAKIWSDVVNGAEGEWDKASTAALKCDQTAKQLTSDL